MITRHQPDESSSPRTSRKLEKKSRILVAVGNYPPGHGGGGLRAHRTYQQTMDLLPLDVTAVTVCGRGEPKGVSNYENVTIIRTRADGGFYAQFIDIGRHILKLPFPPYDIIHAMGLSHVASAACLWGLLLGIPIIREMTIDGPLPGKSGFLQPLIRRGFTKAKLLVALNDRIKKRFLDAGVDSSHIWARPNPVNIDNFRPPAPKERLAIRRMYGLGDADRVHLILGRFQPRKNQAFAVEVASHLGPEHKFLLIGPAFESDKSYLESVKALVSENGLADRFIIIPEAADPASDAYHAADVCWVPSVKEGLPNVMLEALCCGLPVVINEDLAMQAHVMDGINGFNSPLEAGHFAQAAHRASDLSSDENSTPERVTAAHKRYDANRLNAEFAKRLASILQRTQPLILDLKADASK